MIQYETASEDCCIVMQVVGRLDEVSEEVLEFFEPAAHIVMASADPRKAMAAALATLSGITERPKSRSLLTQVCMLSRSKPEIKQSRFQSPAKCSKQLEAMWLT